MPKNKISEYSTTASDNTDIGGINIAEGMSPSDVNNAMREQMSQLKEFLDGSSGDTITTAKIVATTAEILSGVNVTGTATFNSAVIMSSSVTGSALSLSGALTVGGATILSSSLGVTGTASMGVIDATTLEVTNLKAKDGTASATIADSTGVMTVASAVLTTADINGGTVDNASVGAGTPSTGAFTTLSSNSTTTLNGTTIPASKTLLVSTDIGSTVQAYDADTAKYDDTTANFSGTLQNGGSNVLVDTDIGTTLLAYDSNLQGFVTAFTLPTTDGTGNQVLKTDGSGNIGFATIAGTGTVTSVDVSGGTTGLTTSGGPITGSGTITLAGTLAIANGGTGSTSTTYCDLTTNVTGTLPVANGGTGITSFGTGVATFLGTPSSANLAAALTDETGTGVAVFGTNPTLTGVTLAGEAACADNLVTRATLKDYALEGVAIGNTGATRTIDLETGNFFSATLDQACTFTFSNPAASGDFCGFALALTDGDAYTITWPASVDWVGGTAPTLTASGLDLLVFVTYDGGTTWLGLVSGTDIK